MAQPEASPLKFLRETVSFRRARSIGFLEGAARLDAEDVRRLRNDVRANLTRSNKEISVADQWAWWCSPDGQARYIVIARVDVLTDAPIPRAAHYPFIGFGMIQRVGPEGWLTGALEGIWRGRGHGRALFEHMIGWCHANSLWPWLEVYADNDAALKLYEALGFRIQTTRVQVDGDKSRPILVMAKGPRER